METSANFVLLVFYNGRPKTAAPDHARPLPAFLFRKRSSARRSAQATASEDIGRKSKSNEGQAALCRSICYMLLVAPIPFSLPFALPIPIVILFLSSFPNILHSRPNTLYPPSHYPPRHPPPLNHHRLEHRWLLRPRGGRCPFCNG